VNERRNFDLLFTPYTSFVDGMLISARAISFGAKRETYGNGTDVRDYVETFRAKLIALHEEFFQASTCSPDAAAQMVKAFRQQLVLILGPERVEASYPHMEETK
jgi:hypothetical protein